MGVVPFAYYTIDAAQQPYKYNKVVPTGLPTFDEAYNQTQAFTYQGYPLTMQVILAKAQ